MIEVSVISMLILLAAIKAASMLKRATMEATVVALMSLVKLINTAIFLTRINSYNLGKIEFASCNSQLQETFLGAESSATKRGAKFLASHTKAIYCGREIVASKHKR